LIASTSCAFFIDPAPGMPRPAAIDLRSARSIELRPADLEAAFLTGFSVVAEGVSVTWILRTLRRLREADERPARRMVVARRLSQGPGRAGTPIGVRSG
jgi:hypothetical protein